QDHGARERLKENIPGNWNHIKLQIYLTSDFCVKTINIQSGIIIQGEGIRASPFFFVAFLQ
ncbi:MAG TPA: hypothetical protein VK498_13615, partial [Ferruginibacter sp.]|nr:hypothetical protein [Ferruginibacter sp.]